MARRFGRRRKPRVAWLPTFGYNQYVEWGAGPAPGIELDLEFSDTTPGEAVLWDAFPLTFDYTESATATAGTAENTLRDIVQGNEWRLRRIVGKAFIGTWSGNFTSVFTANMDVALGFIVCKTDDDGTPQTDFDYVNPLSQDAMEDPWIWRRRWMLNPSPQYSNNAENRFLPPAWGFPRSTAEYGSVADGPHIDAKTARVIHRSERLFAVLAARRWAANSNPATEYGDMGIKGVLDYRLLGSLRSSSYGNRGNASR